MSEKIVRIGEKYRITIPIENRNSENLKEGDFVACSFCKATVEVRKEQ